mgnify:CR=1 FL=1
MFCVCLFLQAEDGIRDLVRSRGLGDVYKRQMQACARIGAIHSVVFGGFSAKSLHERIVDAGAIAVITADEQVRGGKHNPLKATLDEAMNMNETCLLYTSDAADERSSVDLGGRRFIKKKKYNKKKINKNYKKKEDDNAR